jgi:hypothetical protein
MTGEAATIKKCSKQLEGGIKKEKNSSFFESQSLLKSLSMICTHNLYLGRRLGNTYLGKLSHTTIQGCLVKEEGEVGTGWTEGSPCHPC